ncbi:MAG: aminotransferase, partial [Gammaproteobacteria bacterium]|nr:aminotransferase [Gammaproteobacteria bacterium]
GGEGGLLLCREQGAWERAWSYRDHGKDRSRASADPVAGYRYVHDGPGSNLRMLETQAAIGRLQLRRLGNWLTTRNRNAARLRQWLAEANVTVARPGPGFTHAYYRLGVTLNGNLAQRRDEIIGKMRREGAPISVGSCPALYREKVFAGFAPSRPLPATEKIATACLVLPVHPTLTDGQLDWLGESLCRVLDGQI